MRGRWNCPGCPWLHPRLVPSTVMLGVLLVSVSQASAGPLLAAPFRSFDVAENPTFVAAGDFNGDGRPDLVAVDYASNSVSVLLSDPAGAYGPATHYAAGVNPYSLALADVNGDLKTDLVVASKNSNAASILLGNGSGAFGPASLFSTSARRASRTQCRSTVS